MADIEKKQSPDIKEEPDDLVNASGHIQELDRKFGFWSVCAISLISNDAWAAGAGSLVLALYNGGGPGVLYGLMAASFFYAFICAGLSELASALPSSANVYHWASITPGPRYGRLFSWFAGWWNCIAWIFGCSSTALIPANAMLAIYSLYHPDFVPQRYHIFIAYLGIVIIDTAIVCFGQKYIAKLANASGMLCLIILVISLLLCAIMPSRTGYGYASNAFVWSDWQNLTGWSSNGLVFLMGMLNGAYTVGTPDAVCHLAEEIPNPKVNLPRGIAAQLLTGFATSFIFYIAVLYGTTDLDAVFTSPIVSLPLAAMFQQCVRSNAATFALLFLYFFNIIITLPGAWLTTGRMLWTLGRDNATPFPAFVGKVSPVLRMPLNAQLLVSACAIILGCIYIASATAFNAFVASFVVFTTMSYCTAILPHILTGRKYVKPGPFWIPGVWGYVVMGIACAYILVFNVIYMFPYSYPVANAQLMNWSSVMFAGITFLLSIGYLWKRSRGYTGPQVRMDAHDDIMKGAVGLDKKLRTTEQKA